MLSLSKILLKIGQFIKESKVKYATEALNVAESWVGGDILEFAKTCPTGFTSIYTSATTTNIPEYAHYCSGFILKRTSDQINIILISYTVASSSFICMNTLLDTSWSGWKLAYLT